MNLKIYSECYSKNKLILNEKRCVSFIFIVWFLDGNKTDGRSPMQKRRHVVGFYFANLSVLSYAE